MVFLLGSDGLSPLPVTSQHLLAEFYPEPQEGRTTLSSGGAAATYPWKNRRL